MPNVLEQRIDPTPHDNDSSNRRTMTDEQSLGGRGRAASPSDQPSISLFGRRIPMPRSRLLRIALGLVLILLGCFGFLPILGFWMIPFGFLVLSYDIAVIRRYRRRVAIWWGRRRNGTTVNQD